MCKQSLWRVIIVIAHKFIIARRTLAEKTMYLGSSVHRHAGRSIILEKESFIGICCGFVWYAAASPICARPRAPLILPGRHYTLLCDSRSSMDGSALYTEKAVCSTMRSPTKMFNVHMLMYRMYSETPDIHHQVRRLE